MNSNQNIEIIEGKRSIKSELLSNFESVFKELKSIKLQDEKLQLNLAKQQSNEVKFAEQLNNSTQSLKDLNTQYQEINIQIAEKSKSLNALISPYGFELSDDFAKQLTKRKNNFERGEQKLVQQKNELEVINNNIQNLQNNLTQLKQQLDNEEVIATDLNQRLNLLQTERNELFENKNPKQARTHFRKALNTREVLFQKIQQEIVQNEKSLIANTQSKTAKGEQLATLENDLETVSKTIQTAISTLDFDDIKKLEQAILSNREAEQIEDEYQKLNKTSIQKKQSLTDTKERLNKLQAKQQTDISISELDQMLDGLVFQQKENAENIGGIKEKLNHNDALKKQLEKHQDTIDKQQAAFEKWDELRQLIGSADGKKFRVFAQSLTLRKLSSLANRHLKQLNDRYFISMNEKEILELDIVDRYQGDNQRSMSTLSGGESFLVSLALALGLSDLAGRNAQIQSLFIDEGFGTLDARSLDLVIQTLENLQSSGKTIGVISHVDALKERIYTQIQVVKQGHGFSTIAIRDEVLSNV